MFLYLCDTNGGTGTEKAVTGIRGPGEVARGLGSRARKSEDESFARKHKPQINNQKLKKIHVKTLTLAESHSE